MMESSLTARVNQQTISLHLCKICIFSHIQIGWWLTWCLHHNSELEHSNTSHLHPNYCVDQNWIVRPGILTSPGKTAVTYFWEWISINEFIMNKSQPFSSLISTRSLKLRGQKKQPPQKSEAGMPPSLQLDGSKAKSGSFAQPRYPALTASATIPSNSHRDTNML